MKQQVLWFFFSSVHPAGGVISDQGQTQFLVVFLLFFVFFKNTCSLRDPAEPPPDCCCSARVCPHDDKQTGGGFAPLSFLSDVT